MSSTTSAMGSFYDEKRAASELGKYREKGPIPSTDALIAALKCRGGRRDDAARHRGRRRRDPT